MGVTLAISSAYHPQTDGVTERVNAEIKKYLRTYAEKYGADWDEQLWIAEFAYNNSVHSLTGQTPFMMTKGYNPVSPIEFFTKETMQEYHDDLKYEYPKQDIHYEQYICSISYQDGG